MSHKEKYINNQFDALRQEYHEAKTRLAAISSTHQASSERVNGFSAEYSTLSEQLREIKSKMDNRGSSMTDTSPLVKIKEALTTLKAEIKTYELRIGIVGYVWLILNILAIDIEYGSIFNTREYIYISISISILNIHTCLCLDTRFSTRRHA